MHLYAQAFDPDTLDVDVLCNLWLVRFGPAPVASNTISEDAQIPWWDVLMTLFAAGRMQRVIWPDTPISFYQLKEYPECSGKQAPK